jgi:hypothetical protein
MGNYYASEGYLLTEVTHVYGEYFGRELRWYPIKNEENEDGIELDQVKEKYSDYEIFFNLPLICLPQPYKFHITPSLQLSTTIPASTPYTVSTKYARIGE